MSGPVRHVVLDANAVGVDPPFGKLEHRLLLDAHRSGNIILVVPRLSLREAVNIWKYRVKTQVDKLAGVHGKLRQLAPDTTWPTPALDRDAAAAELLDELTRALLAAGVEMPETPNPPHEELIARALDRRQPFDANGGGYRDALLWLTVLEYATDGRAVVLVSNDHAAFAEGRKEGGALGHTLAEELDEPGAVTLLANPHTTIGELELVEAEALQAVAEVVGRLGDEFAELLRDRLVQDLAHDVHVWVTRDLVNPFAASSVSLGVAYEALGAEVYEARRTDGVNLEAGVALKVRQSLTVFLPVAVADRLRPLGQVARVDQDTASADIDAVVEHRCRILLDPVTDRILEAESIEAVHASV